MPQALVKVNRDALLVIAPDSGPSQRPQLAVLAAQVISSWARLDAELGGLFVELVGGNPRPAAAVYSSLSGAAAKRDAFAGLYNLVLPEIEKEVLEAIMSRVARAARLRNPVAHWVWGYSPQISDAVILVNPADLMEAKLDVTDLTSDIARRIRERRYAAAKPPHPPDPLRENARVYFAQDFTNISADVERVIQFLHHFRSVRYWSESNKESLARITYEQLTMPHTPASELYALSLDRLLAEPVIREFVNRRRQNLTTDQSVPQQSPGGERTDLSG